MRTISTWIAATALVISVVTGARAAPLDCNSTRLSAMELTKCFPGRFDPRPRQPVDSVPSQKAAPGSGALALIGPWEVKRPYLGTTAVGLTEVPPSAPSETYNILAVGLFCGSRQTKAPRINLYVYGLDALRLASNLPVEATFTLDARATNFVLRPYNDVALVPVDAAFVRSLMMARDATVSIKDYRSPDPDRIKMDGAEAAIRLALRGCFTAK